MRKPTGKAGEQIKAKMPWESKITTDSTAASKSTAKKQPNGVFRQ
jgi:hypothetical protein